MRSLVFFGLFALAACGPRQVDLRQAALEALGPAPPGTQLAVTQQSNLPPVGFEGVHVVKTGKSHLLPGTFQRWEIPGEPPRNLFLDQ